MLFVKASLLGVLRVRQGRFHPSGNLSQEKSCPCVSPSLHSGLTKALVVSIAKSPYVTPQISSHSLKWLGHQSPVPHCPSSIYALMLEMPRNVEMWFSLSECKLGTMVTWLEPHLVKHLLTLKNRNNCMGKDSCSRINNNELWEQKWLEQWREKNHRFCHSS